jgi:hypothetical protein
LISPPTLASPQTSSTSTSSGTCLGSIYYHPPERSFKCTNCSFKRGDWILEHIFPLQSKDGILVCILKAKMLKWYQVCESGNSKEDLFGGQFCPPTAKRSYSSEYRGVYSHIKANHTRAEIERVFGKDNVLSSTCDAARYGDIYKHSLTCWVRAQGMKLLEDYGLQGFCSKDFVRPREEYWSMVSRKSRG